MNAYGPEIIGVSLTSESSEQVVSPYSHLYLFTSDGVDISQ
jgi:hypothetical protein